MPAEQQQNINNQLITVRKTMQASRRFSNRLIDVVGPRGSAVERQSLASILSPSCARPVADG